MFICIGKSVQIRIEKENSVIVLALITKHTLLRIPVKPFIFISILRCFFMTLWQFLVMVLYGTYLRIGVSEL